ncbi:Aspartate racemase (EC [Olavius sp. associated proteobacterium Delta 1]|nr:Aspartate racemase (EC [Olavius sp. associated proteobacterium Delta 1]
MEKVIGILGGMGPEATVDCFAKIIENTPATYDQDHLRVVIDSNPKVPDRTAAIIGDGESPVPIMVAGCQALQRAGAEFIIIPCVSAHVFLADVQQQIELPIMSIFDAVAEAITRDHPEIKKVGLLGTTGTVSGGLFQKRIALEDITTLVPDDAMQSRIMSAIYDIKSSRPSRTRSEITDELVAAAESLIAKKPEGAQGIIAGCTEVPLALKQKHLSLPYFDAVTILVRAAILKAGIQPITHFQGKG